MRARLVLLGIGLAAKVFLVFDSPRRLSALILELLAGQNRSALAGAELLFLDNYLLDRLGHAEL